MIYLILSIVCSTLIILVFRGFSTYKINSLQAIIFNYLVCLAFATAFTPIEQIKLIPHWNGLPLTIFLGSLFIFIFFLIAKTTQILGVAVASVAQKLSFIIPVVSGILIFKESASLDKFLGFTLAIVSVFFISANKANRPTIENDSKEANKLGKWLYVLLPFLVFFGAGGCDLLVNIIETKYIGEIKTAAFTFILFITASVFGVFILLFQRIKNNIKIKFKNIFAGIILGVPNYGSIYFLVQALNQSELESSQVFPINNVGIILASVIMAWLLFNERLNFKQAIGLVCAVATILILI